MNPQNYYQTGGHYQNNQPYSQPQIQRGDSRYGNSSQPQMNESSMSQYDRNYQAPPSPTHSEASQSQRESNITHSNIKQEAPQKDANKQQKPSELNTDNLKINDKIEWNKNTFRITTKIHYGKKQFVFEIQDIASFNQQKDSANSANNSQAPESQDNDSDSKMKKKIELPFKDIEKLSFTKQRQEIILETTFDKIKQCQEPKKKGNDNKKTTQWVESNFLLQQDNQTPLFDTKEFITFVSVFPKDTLTKSGSGRMSHLQKIQQWVDVKQQKENKIKTRYWFQLQFKFFIQYKNNLYIDGERYHRISEPTPTKEPQIYRMSIISEILIQWAFNQLINFSFFFYIFFYYKFKIIKLLVSQSSFFLPFLSQLILKRKLLKSFQIIFEISKQIV